MPRTFHLDFESRSRCDIKKVGGHRYAWDKTTEILCLAIAEGDNEPLIWLPDTDNPEGQEWYTVEMHMKAGTLLARLSDPDSIIYAHNATGFEVPMSDALFLKTTGFKPPAHHQWRCTAAMGRRAALPSSLEKLAETLKLTNLKDTKGKSLIRKFCVPQTAGKNKGRFIEPHEDPEAFRAFCEYCRQDVKVEQEIHEKLKDFELTGFAFQTFLLDLEINSRGFPVNLDALRKAEKLVNEETERLTAEFREITGLNPSQVGKVLEWFKSQGFKHDDLRADTMDEVFEDEDFDETTPLGRALSIKKRVSFASLKKIPAMIGCAGSHDNRVRGTLLYHGAGTGRWSAKLVQPQNFKRPAPYMEFLSEQAYSDICDGCTVSWLDIAYGPPLEVVSSCIRHFIHDYGVCDAPHCDGGYAGDCMDCQECNGTGLKGHPMLDADYSAIEARIIAWQAQEQWRLGVFNTHGKIYEASASKMFKVPFSEFEEYAARGKKHPLRHKGKISELACGFGGGPAALERMGALKQGLTKEELPDLITQWREANPAVVTHWRTTEDAAKNAIRNPGKMFMFGIDCCFFTARTAGMNYLFMRLPSGRKLAYPQPELTPHLSWREEKIEIVDGEDEEGRPVKIKKVIKGDAKKMLNPTPEQIAKVRAKYPKARMGESITFFGQIPMSTRWGRISTYGGSLVENCVTGDNEVLTPAGWIRLDTLKEEPVWDGQEFVNHHGLIDQGIRGVIDCHGVLCTPEHEFLVGGEWVSAEKACILPAMEVSLLNYERKASTDRKEVWTNDCYRSFSFRWKENVVACIVSLWEKVCKSRCRYRCDRVWEGLPILASVYWPKKNYTRHVSSLTLAGLEQHEAAMQSPQPSSLPQLWRTWYSSVRPMAAILRSLSPRHGPNMEKRVGHRSSGQQRKLLSRELPMGYTQDKLSEQTQVSTSLGVRSCREERSQALNTALALSQRGEAGSSLLQESRFSRQVYDIRNCGPRNQFVVRSPRTGFLLVAHNCTQAIAADFMAQGALNASAKGYKIVALIHDEALAEFHPEKGQSLEEFVSLLTKLPSWADGMPLAAEGDVVQFYKK